LSIRPRMARTGWGGQSTRTLRFRGCGCKGDWSPAAAIAEQTELIREMVGSEGRAICGLSGGVDSCVAAALVHRAIGERQTCIFVNNGLLREGEFESTLALLKQAMELNVLGVDAEDQFLEALRGITDPEEKRKKIGGVFIDVFEAEAKRIGQVDFLVQGTLYPDVIE